MPAQWVIPDIHGCAETLRILISEKINPQKEDTIYFLGDYVDRGPDSKGVLDYIMSLQHQGFSVRALKGNHEEFFLQTLEAEKNRKKRLFFPGNKFLKGWMSLGGKEMLESFGTENILDVPETYVQWMQQLEYYIELDDFFLVHAGFNFNAPDPFSDYHAMLSIRDFEIQPEKIKNKRIIHGHVPVSLEFIMQTTRSNSYSFIDLDNGCVYKGRNNQGNLVALELGSMELVVQKNVDVIAV